MSKLSIDDAIKLIKEFQLKELGKMLLDKKRELQEIEEYKYFYMFIKRKQFKINIA